MYLFEMVRSDSHLLSKTVSSFGTVRLTCIHCWSDGDTVIAHGALWWASSPYTFLVRGEIPVGGMVDHTLNVAKLVEESIGAVIKHCEKLESFGESAKSEEERRFISGQVYVKGKSRDRTGETAWFNILVAVSLVEYVATATAIGEEVHRNLSARGAFYLPAMAGHEGRWVVPVDMSYRSPALEWRGSYDGFLGDVDEYWLAGICGVIVDKPFE